MCRRVAEQEGRQDSGPSGFGNPYSCVSLGCPAFTYYIYGGISPVEGTSRPCCNRTSDPPSLLRLHLQTSVFDTPSVYFHYSHQLPKCLDTAIHTPRLPPQDICQVTAPAVPSAVLPIPMKIGPRSLILLSAAEFRTVSLKETTVSCLLIAFHWSTATNPFLF